MEADLVLDFGSMTGYVRAADNTPLAFFIKNNLGTPRPAVLLSASYSEPRWVAPAALGWTEIEFLVMLEGAIRRQFHWDNAAQSLVARNSDDFKDPGLAQEAAHRILLFIEDRLNRKTSYMQ